MANVFERAAAVVGTGVNPYYLLTSNARAGLHIIDAVRGQETDRAHSVAELVGAYALALTPITWGKGAAEHIANTVVAAQTGEVQSAELR